jgi:hypothetical protein
MAGAVFLNKPTDLSAVALAKADVRLHATADAAILHCPAYASAGGSNDY